MQTFQTLYESESEWCTAITNLQWQSVNETYNYKVLMENTVLLIGVLHISVSYLGYNKRLV